MSLPIRAEVENSATLEAEVEAQGVQDMQAGTTSQAAPQHQVAKGEMVWS